MMKSTSFVTAAFVLVSVALTGCAADATTPEEAAVLEKSAPSEETPAPASESEQPFTGVERDLRPQNNPLYRGH